MVIEIQEIIKLLAAISGAVCVGFGIHALYRGIKVDGEVDFSALMKGKVKSGSAGIFLLFFGITLFAIVILKGSQSQTIETREQTTQKISTSTNALPTAWQTNQPSVESHTKIETQKTSLQTEKKPWWKFW